MEQVVINNCVYQYEEEWNGYAFVKYVGQEEKISILDFIENIRVVKVNSFCLQEVEQIQIGDKTVHRKKEESKSSVREICLPNGLQVISSCAFFACDQLRKISLPESVTIVEPCAFEDCELITEIKIPSVKNISRGAFRNCKSLITIQLSNELETIGMSGFEGCIKLKECKLSSSLKSIGNRAFYECSALEDLYFGEQLSVVGQSAFAKSGIKSLDLKSTCVTTLPSHLCYQCKQMISVSLPNTVQIICRSAFEKCSKLKQIKCFLIEKIEGRAFADCTDLDQPEFIELLSDYEEDAFDLSPMEYYLQ